MKRDMDLIRDILLALEKKPDISSTEKEEALPGVSLSPAVWYHMRLLLDAGLIKGRRSPEAGSPKICFERLTWAGHEFLDVIRNDSIWHRLKLDFAVEGGTAFFEKMRSHGEESLIQTIFDFIPKAGA